MLLVGKVCIRSQLQEGLKATGGMCWRAVKIKGGILVYFLCLSRVIGTSGFTDLFWRRLLVPVPLTMKPTMMTMI